MKDILNMLAIVDDDDESDEEEVYQEPIPRVEAETVTDNDIKREKSKIHNFTSLQSHIKRACLFPPFELIQQFADDLYF